MKKSRYSESQIMNILKQAEAGAAVAESFFSSLKKERVRKIIYKTRDDARSEIFDYIEVFYNRKRRHSHLGNVSPVDYERIFLEDSKCLLKCG